MTARSLQILVINSGSSSLKFSVLEVQSESVLVSGIAERLGTMEALLKFSDTGAHKFDEPLPGADHRAALRRVVDHLRASLPDEVDAVGHRIVHGGEYFRDAVIIDDEVVKRIEELSNLAPLHNPAGAQGIRLALGGDCNRNVCVGQQTVRVVVHRDQHLTHVASAILRDCDGYALDVSLPHLAGLGVPLDQGGLPH